MVTSRKLMIGAAVLAVAATLAMAGGVFAPGEPESAALLRPDDSALVAEGQGIYADNCASCHGDDLAGETGDWRVPKADGLMPAPPHDETGHTWHHPDEVLFKITKLGVAKAANLDNYQSAMPAYDGILADDEIVAVLSYIKSKWPEEIRKGHDDMNARYALEPKETR